MNIEPSIPVVVLIAVSVVAFGWVALTWAGGNERPRTLRHLGLVVCGLLVLARPGTDGETQRQTQLQDVDVVFAVDVTTSMVAEDYAGDRPRLDGVRADLEYLLDDLAGARFSLVTFGSDAIVEVPFTTDRTAMASVVDTLRAEPYLVARGSNIERPVDELTELLQTAKDALPDRARLLFVFGDGEAVSGDRSRSEGYDQVADLVDGGLVLGYGTSDGGPMREGTLDIDDEGDYITDSNGDDAISAIDEDTLGDVAADVGVAYAHRTAPGGLGELVDADAISVEATGEATTARRDMTWIPAMALGALVLGEAWDITLSGVRTRRWWAT